MWRRERLVRLPSSPRAGASLHSSTQLAADLAPLTRRQLWVLARAAARELSWGMPAVSRELRHWRERARLIPDLPIREDALSALHRKRGQSDGAALFSILPAARDPAFLRLLVAYQVIWDFLDSVHERAADPRNGLQLHTALVDALDPARAPRDYYRYHPWRDDGGYLRELVETCRANCVRLRGFAAVAPLLAVEARRAEVLALNHDLDAVGRDASLRAWARREFPDAPADPPWWELSGAASAGLTIFALLALAADGTTSRRLLHDTRAAYFPWTSVAATMLDSYVDRAEDEANGDHSYVAHYATPELAVQRLCELVRGSLAGVGELPNGEGHVLIVACMAAMYLTKYAASTPAMKRDTARIASSGGSLTRALLPVLRLWRFAYAQRST